MAKDKLWEYSVVFILEEKVQDLRDAGGSLVKVPEGVTGYVIDPQGVSVNVFGVDGHSCFYHPDALMKVLPADVEIVEDGLLKKDRIAQFNTEYSWNPGGYQITSADDIRARKGQLCIVGHELRNGEFVVYLEGGAFMPCPARVLQSVRVS